MSIKRKIAITAIVMLIGIALLIGVLSTAYVSLPSYLESRIIPQMMSDAGITDYSVDVRHVGFFSADLGTLRIGPPHHPALMVRSVQIDYALRDLYRRKIKQVLLSGIEVQAVIQGGRFKLQGTALEKLLAGAEQSEQSETPPGDADPAIFVEQMSVRDSRLVIKNRERIYRLPVEIDVSPRDTQSTILEIAARFYPRGETIGARLNLNRIQNRAALHLDATKLDLSRFADITARTSNLNISGLLEMTAAAKLGINPLQILAVDASVALRQTDIRAPGFHLRSTSSIGAGDVPIRIRLSENQPDVWRITGGSLSMIAPARLHLSQLDGTIRKNKVGLIASVDTRITPGSPLFSGSQPLRLTVQNPVPLGIRISAEYHQTGQWNCNISDIPAKNSNVDTLRFDAAPYSIALAPPAFSLSARSASHQIEADYRLSLPSLKIGAGPESITLPLLKLEGNGRLDDLALDTQFKLSAAKTGIILKDGKFTLPKITVIGRLNRDADRQIVSDGRLEFSGGSGRLTRQPVQIVGARGNIPLQWPPSDKIAQGTVYVSNIIVGNMKLGSVHSDIRQTIGGFSFKGRHQNALLPRLKSTFSGTSNLFGRGSANATARVEFSRSAAAPEIDLGRFFPGARGIRIKGNFQLAGDLTHGPKGFGGKFRADLNDAKLQWDQSKLSLEGIRVTLRMPELPKLRSAPGLPFYFSQLSLGEFVARDGRIDFQIESDQSLLLEGIRFKWCDGNVETQSMRLSPAADDFSLTFYCDRLNLAKVLEQFGAAAAEGQGTVNGRIPLQYTDGKIRFDDGFLFSTPGEGGKIRLSGTDILTAGIPPDTPQYVQMELAKEALKDYDYSWAKLNLNSQGEELLLQMQMDGKPARRLPFVYRKDIGGFMKVEANAQGSKFQGIRLDVNFRLPLNKLLQYKELLEMIQ
jgi:hypothetical protein